MTRHSLSQFMMYLPPDSIGGSAEYVLQVARQNVYVYTATDYVHAHGSLKRRVAVIVLVCIMCVCFCVSVSLRLCATKSKK